MLRTDLLNHLILKYKLKSYLELGVQDRTKNFDLVKCEYKAGVDIAFIPELKYQMTTDEFFQQYYNNKKMSSHLVPWDLIFIDASHYAHQVEKDYLNAVEILSPGGFIVLHDCNPLLESHAAVPRLLVSGHWNGDVYKVACKIKEIITVDIDNGCGVVRSGHTAMDHEGGPNDWNDFNLNRAKYLNLVSWWKFINFDVPS